MIAKFFENFPSEIQKLLMRLDRERADNEDSDDESDDDDDDELEQIHLEYGGMSNDNKGGGDSENNKNQEYMMQQFKKFDEIVIRWQTRHIDRTHRKISNQRGLYSSTQRNKRKHKNSHNQQNGKRTNTDVNHVIEETKSEEEDGDY